MSKSKLRSNEEKFWAWFLEQEQALFGFRASQEELSADLTEALEAVHPDLSFEFGPPRSGQRDFTISAGGISGAFPDVRRLVEAAPSLPRWRVLAFQQRKPISRVAINGVELRMDQVWLAASREGDKLEVTLFVEGYRRTPEDPYGQIAYAFLDAVLGELDVESYLGGIEILPLPDPIPGTLRPLSDLASLVDAMRHPT